MNKKIRRLTLVIYLLSWRYRSHSQQSSFYFYHGSSVIFTPWRLTHCISRLAADFYWIRLKIRWALWICRCPNFVLGPSEPSRMPVKAPQPVKPMCVSSSSRVGSFNKKISGVVVFWLGLSVVLKPIFCSLQKGKKKKINLRSARRQRLTTSAWLCAHVS